MALMIPCECDLERRPMSERIVFDAVRDRLSDEWRVFHSFDFVTRDKLLRLWDGEIDFLLYHPERGLLVLEVKGGAISYRDGQWYQEDRPIFPVRQAKHNKYVVMQLLQNKLKRTIPLRFAHAVCFPSCTGHRVWPAEAQGLVLTGDRLNCIEEFAIEVLQNAPLPENARGDIAESEVMRVLSPLFEYGQSLAERIGIEQRQFFLFTEEQCRLLDMLENFKRLQIVGCAGAGKTIMALKKAKRLALRGQNVLLLCYNQMLAKYLRKEVGTLPGITAAAFFEFCIEIMKLPAEQVDRYRSDPRLYREVLPKLLRGYVERSCLCYDAVIVDEGQDFSRTAWDVISLLPVEDGYFYIFYDPDQNIFNSELELPDFGIPPVRLTRNCRNTRNIFAALAPYRSTEAAAAEFAPDGSAVRDRSGEDLRGLLAEELERLIDREGVTEADVVILGGHALRHTALGDDPRVGRFTVVERHAAAGSSEVAFFTYMKFKGCEAKAVILFDVDENDPRWNRNGMYTAMSRAVHELVILRRPGSAKGG